MGNIWRKVLVVGAIGLCGQSAGWAQTTQRPDLGKREFETRCASCHGLTGQGNGTITDLLRKSPPDLTQLARRNGGILPVDRLYQSITGDAVLAHGSRDMPIWGMVYRTDAASHYVDVPYDAEGYVRSRVLVLLDYIARLQR